MSEKQAIKQPTKFKRIDLSPRLPDFGYFRHTREVEETPLSNYASERFLSEVIRANRIEAELKKERPDFSFLCNEEPLVVNPAIRLREINAFLNDQRRMAFWRRALAEAKKIEERRGSK